MRTVSSSSRQGPLNVRNPLLVRQAQWRISRHLPRALASGARDLQPGVTARCSSARVGVGECAERGEVCSPVTCDVLFGARRRARAWRREICSPARCSARVGVGEGAGARGLQFSVVAMCYSAVGAPLRAAIPCPHTRPRTTPPPAALPPPSPAAAPPRAGSTRPFPLARRRFRRRGFRRRRGRGSAE